MSALGTSWISSIRAVALTAAFAGLAASPAAAVQSRSTAIDLTPAEDQLWVVNPDHGTVGVIATATNTFVDEVTVGSEPWCVDVHPDNGEAWVTSQGDNNVTIIDVATRTVLTTIDDLGFETFGVSFSPDGQKALVTATGSDELFVIDVDTRTVTDTLPVFRRPRGICWKPDGTRAWITHMHIPDFFGRLTTFFESTTTTSEIIINQTFNAQFGGYPSNMQNISLAPPPFDDYLWIPNVLINATAGQLAGNPLTPANIMHAIISPVNATTSSHLSTQNYYLSETGTDVGGPIATDFYAARAYTAHLHSNNVTASTQDVLSPTEVGVVPVGDAPIGIVTATLSPRIYTANWLSRDVTVIANGGPTVVTTVPSTAGPEPLTPSILNGKRLFFTSNGVMAQNDVGSCASCHVWGGYDAQEWDLSQFGKHKRNTPDLRGIGWTGAHDWTADKDEMQDHEFGILEFTGGVGLLAGSGGPNPTLGTPNKGISKDLDDIGQFMATLTHRTTTPFRNPDGTMTADALAGEVLFNSPATGCADCHIPPFYTDSTLQAPFIKHVVGTVDSLSGDTDALPGLDTPSLCGIWDTQPYLHTGFAQNLMAVVTTFNPADEHGTTSHLTAGELDQLVAFLQQIAWPTDPGTAVSAPEIGVSRNALDPAYPNPFAQSTSLRFTLPQRGSAVRLDVFDVSGRRVRTIFDRPIAKGTHVAGWDSRDDFGSRVAPGVYFARLTVDGQSFGEKKMTVVR